jgi:hypothetical protein
MFRSLGDNHKAGTQIQNRRSTPHATATHTYHNLTPRYAAPLSGNCFKVNVSPPKSEMDDVTYVLLRHLLTPYSTALLNDAPESRLLYYICETSRLSVVILQLPHFLNRE